MATVEQENPMARTSEPASAAPTRGRANTHQSLDHELIQWAEKSKKLTGLFEDTGVSVGEN